MNVSFANVLSAYNLSCSFYILKLIDTDMIDGHIWAIWMVVLRGVAERTIDTSVSALCQCILCTEDNLPGLICMKSHEIQMHKEVTPLDQITGLMVWQISQQKQRKWLTAMVEKIIDLNIVMVQSAWQNYINKTSVQYRCY